MKQYRLSNQHTQTKPVSYSEPLIDIRKTCGRLLPFAVPYAEWTDRPHPFRVLCLSWQRLANNCWRYYHFRCVSLKYKAADKEYTSLLSMEYCLHCPFLLAMQRPPIIMHVNCSSNYDSNLVHILLHLVSFNILLAIFSSCLHQKYGVHVGLM